jgi:ABC-type branched-subunit amino acid transport system ATPase component
MTIEVKNVKVQFGSVVALDDVSLQFGAHQIVAVIGANGSGKSTLFNSITGFVDVTSGSICIDGAEVVGVPAFKRIANGLARTFQTPRFDPTISVEKAVMCGFYPVSRAGFMRSIFATPAAMREEAEMVAKCDALLEDFKLNDLRHMQMGELPMGQVRLVEVARAVANKPKYLLLDEPAAGLTKVEQTLLGDEIRRLARSGVGILLFEHNFNMIRELSEHVVVLDRGTVLITGRPDKLAGNRDFVNAYLGTSGH